METINTRNPPHKLVLLVDDSAIDNFVNQRVIERNQFSKTVIAFTKANEALNYLMEVDKNKSYETDLPSIIFLDVNMPVMNGHEFIKLFKNLSKEIKCDCKIIILTSSISPLDQNIPNNNKEVLAFLSKPLMKNSFDLIDLLLNANHKIY